MPACTNFAEAAFAQDLAKMVAVVDIGHGF